MFENIEDLFDLNTIGIGPVKSVVDCIEYFAAEDQEQERVLNLSIAASEMLSELSKCVERMDRQQGQPESAEDTKKLAVASCDCKWTKNRFNLDQPGRG